MSMNLTELPHFASVDQVKAELDAQNFAIGTVDPAAYHKWKGLLGTPSVSKSALTDFDANRYVYKYNADHAVRKETPALRKGSLIDCLALTPDLYDTQYTCEDINARTKEGKARKAELAALGITIISPDEKAEAQQAATAAREVLARMCPLAPGADRCYLTQVAMWVRIDAINEYPLATPLIVTGMLDVLPLDEGTPLIDLKSTSVDIAQARKVNGNMSDFGYGIQAALYRDLFEVCTGQDRGFKFLFVTAELPVQTRVAGVDDGTICFYRSRYQQLLIDYADAVANGDWGQRDLPEMTFEPPVWELRKGVEE